jgi:hypothetical protein
MTLFSRVMMKTSLVNTFLVVTHAVDPRPNDLARIAVFMIARCGSVLMTMARQMLLL